METDNPGHRRVNPAPPGLSSPLLRSLRGPFGDASISKPLGRLRCDYLSLREPVVAHSNEIVRRFRHRPSLPRRSGDWTATTQPSTLHFFSAAKGRPTPPRRHPQRGACDQALQRGSQPPQSRADRGVSLTGLASAAKQSTQRRSRMDCFVAPLVAMTTRRSDRYQNRGARRPSGQGEPCSKFAISR